ncbi:MAG TPA: hydroxyacylglutathione hydrolase [Candidatus Binataceae bacterium]|jgi:hydroxyacylglutathione hydrolase|nr:hydroxyacylglutathione hydrolase [Candidatus Binataceae bacterium]
MAIIAVPQLSDNFAYLVVDDATKECGVVDCAEAGKVLAEVKRQGLNLTTVLSTHWHFDHVGGNNDLRAALPRLRIYGARAENGRIPSLTDPIDDGDEVRVGGLRGRAIGIPAHTNGHVAYYFPTLKAVFSGDTLFIAGCGRLFEGGAATMVNSLSKLAALPDDTQVFCGHEYTQKNLAFALTLEPGNGALNAKHEWAVRTRREGKWTVPSTIGEEKQFNPFLRTDSPEIRASVARVAPGLDDAVAIFAKIRELKDHF